MVLSMGSFDTSLAEAEALLAGFDTDFDDGEFALTVRVRGSVQERAAAQRLLDKHGFFRYGSTCQRPLGELALTERYAELNAA